ncbi:O-antigen/teichoic acid export membrane protein [Luteibacter sp. Sphag1AF]|uniref:lipopolysaccharide biosynthesis protein n=1 Tax=Luteibacter sp. Sphag1AF TaxID=2587031 RepID=UPI00160ABBD5|nr:oligosaccharide flippase family protein [Luteibacter sp. Sphag1AF]MBB3225428.1 O-antigen/teichoic acid export membrane protein [Luteibacter sp. Sphag1AF]
MSGLSSRVVHWRAAVAASPLLRHTALGTFWQLSRLLCQVVLLVVLARALGPTDYGMFAGFAGLATVLAGLSGLGSGMLLIKEVAADPRVWSRYWSGALRLSAGSGMVLLLLYALTAPHLLRIAAPLIAVLSLGAADLICYPLVYLAGFSFQAFERVGWATALPTSMAFARLAGALAFLSAPIEHSLFNYAFFHMTASLLATLFAIGSVHKHLHPTAERAWIPLREITRALRFSANWFTSNALGELDKSLALRFSSPALAGTYTIAYRMGSALATPVTTIVLASQPRLFALTAANRRADIRALAKKLIAITCFYGAAATVAMLVLARLLPWLLGANYDAVRTAANMLVLFPFVFSIRLIAGSVLTSTGHPGLRASVEASAVVLMIVLAAIIMPGRGLGGIVITTLTTEVILATVLLYLTIVRLRRGNDYPARLDNKA